MATQAKRPDPYVRRDPNDVIRAGDWNDLQVRAREEIHAHTHSGAEDGAPLPRAGIQDGAIDGSKIDRDAAVELGSLIVRGDLQVQGKTISKDVEHHAGDVSLGDEDGDVVKVSGVLRSAHSSGVLQVDDGLQVAGPMRVGQPGSKGEFTIDGEGKVGIGTSDPAERLTVNGAISGFGIVPIGSITAWYKSSPGTPLQGTPPLPAGWMECNGQPVDDKESPYNGQTLPDLNNTGRFLRGSLTSGTLQNQMFEDHQHYGPSNGTVHSQAWSSGYGFHNWLVPSQGEQSNPYTDHTGRAAGGSRGSETRPINMSVVWIMRIK